MADVDFAQLQTNVSCPLCLDPYRDPLVMPCQHSLCRTCVQTLMKNFKIKCPICRAVSHEPFLKPNFVLTGFVEWYNSEHRKQGECSNQSTPNISKADSHSPSLKKRKLDAEVVCQLCEKQVGEHYCTGCGRITCETCNTTHLKLTTCKKTDTQNLAAVVSRRRANVKEVLEQQGASVVLFNNELATVLGEYDTQKTKALANNKKMREEILADVNRCFDCRESVISNTFDEYADKATQKSSLILQQFTQDREKLEGLLSDKSDVVVRRTGEILNNVKVHIHLSENQSYQTLQVIPREKSDMFKEVFHSPEILIRASHPVAKDRVKVLMTKTFSVSEKARFWPDVHSLTTLDKADFSDREGNLCGDLDFLEHNGSLMWNCDVGLKSPCSSAALGDRLFVVDFQTLTLYPKGAQKKVVARGNYVSVHCLTTESGDYVVCLTTESVAKRSMELFLEIFKVEGLGQESVLKVFNTEMLLKVDKSFNITSTLVGLNLHVCCKKCYASRPSIVQFEFTQGPGYHFHSSTEVEIPEDLAEPVLCASDEEGYHLLLSNKCNQLMVVASNSKDGLAKVLQLDRKISSPALVKICESQNKNVLLVCNRRSASSKLFVCEARD